MNPALDTIALLSTADLSTAEALLRQIPNDDPANSFVPSVLAQIKSGKANLAEIVIDNQKCGITVFFIEDFGNGHLEFVSIATKTTVGGNLRYSLSDTLCAFAKANGCKSIRMSTVRHGLVKSALAIGWHTAEIVLRKNIHE